MIKYTLLLTVVLLCISCQKQVDPLELALQQAGNNRAELEKILAHYSSNPADSLKYRAAVFLIQNMPCYYSYKNDKPTRFQKELYPTAIQNNCTGEEAFRILEQKYGSLNPGEFEKIYDIQVMTAGYLIRNIEQAFKVWQENKLRKLERWNTKTSRWGHYFGCITIHAAGKNDRSCLWVESRYLSENNENESYKK